VAESTSTDLATKVSVSPTVPASSPPRPKPSENGEVNEAIQLVKTYVVQETVGPLLGIGRKIAFGTAGALAMGIGLLFLSLGLLRLLQDKVPDISTGSWSWVSYVIVIVFSGLVSGFALWRVSKIEKELK
jgi:hypothetical protein